MVSKGSKSWAENIIFTLEATVIPIGKFKSPYSPTCGVVRTIWGAILFCQTRTLPKRTSSISLDPRFMFFAFFEEPNLISGISYGKIFGLINYIILHILSTVFED